MSVEQGAARGRAAGMIAITVNGEKREIEASLTVDALFDALALRRSGSAVAVNAMLVPRSQHQVHILADGDIVDVVHAVAGG